MGSSGSKQADSKPDKNAQSRNRSESPKEKHNSAGSKAPLAEHAARFASPRISSPERHTSIASNVAVQHARTNSNEDEILRASCASSITSPPTAYTKEPNANINVDDVEGHANVTRPPPPPRLHHLDELMDPAELPIDCHIRSPSGTMLALEQFLVHPDRPRSIRERQEEIKEKVRAASRLGMEAEKGEDESNVNADAAGATGEERAKTKKRKFRHCWCFGSS